MTTEKDIHNIITMLKLRNSEYDFRRVPLDVEQSLLDKIRQGKYNEIHIPPFSKINNNVGSLDSSPLIKYSYIVVSAVTLFSRVAIDSGILPDDVYDLSDAFLFMISYCKTLKELDEIYQLAAVMFAKLIYTQKENKHLYQVKRILNYISCNIFKKITLEEISDYIGLSQNYISSLFSSEMGISLHNYIQREKITVACNLLKFSDRSISDISSYMGFQTQSNFTAIFRKWMKMSPSEYRRMNYKEVF